MKSKILIPNMFFGSREATANFHIQVMFVPEPRAWTMNAKIHHPPVVVLVPEDQLTVMVMKED